MSVIELTKFYKSIHTLDRYRFVVFAETTEGVACAVLQRVDNSKCIAYHIDEFKQNFEEDFI